MSKHQVTWNEKEFNDWKANRWMQAAFSAGRGENKSIEVNGLGTIRVINHGAVVYQGIKWDVAKKRYNNASPKFDGE